MRLKLKTAGLTLKQVLNLTGEAPPHARNQDRHWARISTTEQETANQVAQLQKRVQRRGLDVVQIYPVAESAFQASA